MREVQRRIAENLAGIRQRIADAAKKSGRTAANVTLVAVTKYVDAEATLALVHAGCRDLGESRPQALWLKADTIRSSEDAALFSSIRWHMIGPLQRNKVRRTLPLLALLHSCDSTRLLEELDRVAGQEERILDALLEVNISGDATKHGFAPDDMSAVVEQLPRWPSVRVRGLMAMATLEGDRDAARRNFVALRQLRDQLMRELPAGVSLDELSMGMSGDYDIAIEEGATLVRIGSALFQGL